MHSTNNYDSDQNYVYCRNDCGARITFSNNAISKNGKKIPLQENGLPHNCPKSHLNRRQELQESNRGFVKEIENTERHATIDSRGGYPDPSPDWNPNQRQLSNKFYRKITQEQQLYVDTISPAVLEIRSAVQDIKQLLTQEKERGI